MPTPTIVPDLKAALAAPPVPSYDAAPPTNTGAKLSVDQFADTIKQKYPVYGSIDNKELVDKMLAKYPVYADKVDMGAVAPPEKTFSKYDIPHVQTGAPIVDLPANAAIGTANVAKNFAAGFASDAMQTGFNIADLATKGVGKLAGAVGLPGVQKNVEQFAADREKQNVIGKVSEPFTSTISGKVGQGASELAQFAVPGTKISTASKVVGGALEHTPWILQKLAQAGTESAGYGATQYVKSGGDTKSAQDVALTAGPLSFLGHVGMAAFGKIVPQTVKENLAGFLGYTGKQNLKALVDDKKVIDSTKAITTILGETKEKAIHVLDEAGVAKPWDPNKTTLHEFAQAFRATKEKLFSLYDSAAQKAGDAGARFTQKDIGPIIDKLDGFISNRSSPFANKAAELKADISRIFLEKTPQGMAPIKPVDMQTFLQDLNHFVQSEPKTPAAKVVAETADMLREALDNKISSATGAQYAQLKQAYSQLKTMEPDLVKQLARMKNKGGVGLSDIVDGLSAIDLIQGIATANPNMVMRGVAIGAVKAYKQFSKNPEYALLRAVRILNRGEEAPTSIVPHPGATMAPVQATPPGSVIDLRKGVK